MKIKISERLLLMATALLASYQIVVGVEQLDTLAMISYTIAFGMLLVACLLLVILGWEILDSHLVVVASTIIPLSLSLGIIAQFRPQDTNIYLLFTIAGFLSVVVTRILTPGRTAVIVLAIVHGISGLIITIAPILLTFSGETTPIFILVGIGGAFIGIGGILLSFLKTGSHFISNDQIITVLPWLLLLMTLCYVVGFARNQI